MQKYIHRNQNIKLEQLEGIHQADSRVQIAYLKHKGHNKYDYINISPDRERKLMKPIKHVDNIIVP